MTRRTLAAAAVALVVAGTAARAQPAPLECPPLDGAPTEVAARLASLTDASAQGACLARFVMASPDKGEAIVRAIATTQPSLAEALWGFPPSMTLRDQHVAAALWVVAEAIARDGHAERADALRRRAVWLDPDSTTLVRAYVQQADKSAPGRARASSLCQELADRQQWSRLRTCLQAARDSSGLAALWAAALANQPRLGWKDLEAASRAAPALEPALAAVESCRHNPMAQVAAPVQQAPVPVRPAVSGVYEQLATSLFEGGDSRTGLCALGMASSSCLREQLKLDGGCYAVRSVGRYAVELFRAGGQEAVEPLEDRLREDGGTYRGLEKTPRGRRVLYHYHVAMAGIYDSGGAEAQQAVPTLALEKAIARQNHHRAKAEEFWVAQDKKVPKGLLPVEKTKKLLILQGLTVRLGGGAGYQTSPSASSGTGGLFEVGLTAASGDSSFVTASSGSVTALFRSHESAPWRIAWHLYEFEQLYFPPTQNVFGFGVSVLRGQHDVATDRHIFRWLEATLQLNPAGTTDGEIEFYSDGRWPFFVGVSLDHLFLDDDIFAPRLVVGMAPMWRSGDAHWELSARVFGRFNLDQIDDDVAVESELSIAFVGGHELFSDDGNLFRVALVARHAYWAIPIRSIGMYTSAERQHSVAVTLSIQTSLLDI